MFDAQKAVFPVPHSAALAACAWVSASDWEVHGGGKATSCKLGSII